MDFIYNDGGRAAAGWTGKAGDCACRAIAIATGIPYQEIYDGLNRVAKRERAGKRKRGKSSARDGMHGPSVRRFMASIGWRWVPTMRIGSGCKVHLTDGELPKIGALVVVVSRHYTAVVNGIIHDTYDPQREAHVIERDVGQPLKAGQWRNSNGICSIRRRCVYGYFEKGSP